MLTSKSDYEYYQNQLNNVDISGCVIPYCDTIGVAQTLRLEDAAYLLETCKSIIGNGNVPNTLTSDLTQLNQRTWFNSVRTSLTTLENSLRNNNPYDCNGNYLLNDVALSEFENVVSTGGTGIYNDFIVNNSLQLNTYPAVQYLSSDFTQSSYPISADNARVMYHWLLKTKFQRAIRSNVNQTNHRYWYGWKAESQNKVHSGTTTSGITWRSTYDYTYGNTNYGTSQNIGNTYYTATANEAFSYRLIDSGTSYNNTWMVEEGQFCDGATFTLSRKPSGDVYYLWSLAFKNNNVGGGTYYETIPYTLNGLSSGYIIGLEKLTQTGDYTFKSNKFMNIDYLRNLATRFGFDTSTIGTKNESGGSSSWGNFKYRKGLTFTWTVPSPRNVNTNHILIAKFENEPFYIQNWNWELSDYGQNPMPPSDQPAAI